MGFRSDFRAGVRVITPLLPPAATLAAAAGVAAPVAGLSTLQAVAMSVLLYFPSVMLTALGLLEAGLPDAVIVVTSLVVGIRVVILSISIAPYFKRFPTRWKWPLAYFLWTPVYALTIERFAADPDADVRGYYLGMAVPLWVTVHTSVLAGSLFSASVPGGLDLGVIVPLAFIALLRNFLTDRATTLAAIVGGVAAVLGAGIPFGLGIAVATALGAVTGVAYRARGRW